MQRILRLHMQCTRKQLQRRSPSNCPVQPADFLCTKLAQQPFQNQQRKGSLSTRIPSPTQFPSNYSFGPNGHCRRLETAPPPIDSPSFRSTTQQGPSPRVNHQSNSSSPSEPAKEQH
ncbi:hypothetical protein Nepgr_021410 [Nepenthes gracilis]|uniref:Uncharacterized protein n=1 Tax=Nepenthes gracilis TaxID=150966 RepID=A0AAD3SYL0_NEPGR|nr:hypothetical protein Nepgr_021410 [Nepenthes gracilis]